MGLKYRLLEKSDMLISNTQPYWVIEKRNIFGYWTSYFEEHSNKGAIFFNKQEAEIWYNYHKCKTTRMKTKIIAQH